MKNLYLILILLFSIVQLQAQYSINGSVTKAPNNGNIPFILFAHLVNNNDQQVINSIQIDGSGYYFLQQNGVFYPEGNYKIYINKYQFVLNTSYGANPVPSEWNGPATLPNNWTFFSEYLGTSDAGLIDGISGNIFLTGRQPLCDPNDPDCVALPPIQIFNANFTIQTTSCKPEPPSFQSGRIAHNKSFNYSFNEPTVLAPCSDCVSSSITFNPTNSASLNAQNYVIWNPDYNGPLQIIGTYTNTCGSTSTILEGANVDLDLTSNSPVCLGSTLSLIPKALGFNSYKIYKLTANNTYEYEITNNEITNFDASKAGKYHIEGTVNGNPFSKTITVEIANTAPNISFINGAINLPFNPPNEIYTTDAPAGSNLTYTISPQNAGVISAAGELNVNDDFRGNFSVTATISTDCGIKIATRNVDIPIYDITSNSPVCEGDPIIFTIATNPGPLAGYDITGPNGNVPNNGQDLTVTIPNATLNMAGVYTLEALAWLGSATTTVIVNPLPPNITFTTGATILPQNSPNETYTTDAPNSFTVAYTISPSNAGIISASGEVDWNSTFYGTAFLNASISNSCGNQSASKFVLINQVFPLINCPTNLLVPVAVGITSAIANFSLPTVAGSTVIQTAGLSSGSSFPIGNTTISIMATNSLGNSVVCSFVVAVYPETAPLVENSQIPNAVPDPATGNFSISSTIFDVTIPSGELISGLLITTFPAGAESITINGITYGPPTAGGRIKYGRSNLALVPFPSGGVIAQTNEEGVPEQPILVNPISGSNQVIIEFFAVSGANIQSPLPAMVTVNFASGPLPITLINFRAKLENQIAILNWKTSQETNNKGFEIERSFNAKKFEKIGFQESNKNSFEIKNYEYLDRTPTQGAEWLFYRLKQIDLDGKYTYSKIVSLQNDKNPNFYFYPNPVTNRLILSNIKENSNYHIVNYLGQTLLTGVLNSNNTIEVTNLKAGIYFLIIESEIRKFVKM